MSNKTISLPLAGLSHRCAQETELFFQRMPYEPEFCFELFRRALVERNQQAYAYLYARYEPLVAGWVERQAGFAAAGEEPAYFVNRAFEKMWNAITGEKFSRFNNLKALLGYLKLCATSAVIDHARARQNTLMNAEYSELALAGHAAVSNLEREALLADQRRELWQIINKRLPEEKERVVVYASFVLAMKPAEVQLHYPLLFPDVKDVYRTKQTVLERLRRDPEMARLYQETAN